MENSRNRQAAQANAFRVSTPVPANFEFCNGSHFRYAQINHSRSSSEEPRHLTHLDAPPRLTECHLLPTAFRHTPAMDNSESQRTNGCSDIARPLDALSPGRELEILQERSQMRCDCSRRSCQCWLAPAHFPGNRITRILQRRAVCSAVPVVKRDISAGDLGLDPYVTRQQHDLCGRSTGSLFRM